MNIQWLKVKLFGISKNDRFDWELECEYCGQAHASLSHEVFTKEAKEE